jgi:peptidylglycine monooxygenase
VLDDGRVVVGDRENDRIQFFDEKGRYLSERGGFYHPMSIFADSEQNIYVSDQVPRLVAISSKDHAVSMCRPVLNWSHGIYGDSKGNIYCSESRPNRITRLALLPEGVTSVHNAERDASNTGRCL